MINQTEIIKWHDRSKGRPSSSLAETHCRARRGALRWLEFTTWTTNLLSLRNRAGMLPLGQCSLEDLFTQAADEIPCCGLPIAYDFQRGRRLNLTIIDAARFYYLGVGPPVEIPKNFWVNNERLFIQPIELAFLASTFFKPQVTQPYSTCTVLHATTS